jgi:hypothetical protein
MNDLAIGSARGGRKPLGSGDLDIQVVRALGPEDLPLLAAPLPIGSLPPTVQSLRASHHQLAQLVALGMSDGDAALATGYSLSRVSILKADPTFQQLLEHYSTQRELRFADVLERMKVLGLSTLDELQARLEENPNGFANRELLEMVDLMLVKSRSGPGMATGPGGQAPVTVNVSFVEAGARSGPTINGEPVK